MRLPVRKELAYLLNDSDVLKKLVETFGKFNVVIDSEGVFLELIRD